MKIVIKISMYYRKNKRLYVTNIVKIKKNHISDPQKND